MVEMDVAADNDVMFVHYNTLVSHNDKFLTDPGRYYGCFQGDPPEVWYGPGFLLFLKSLIDSGQWNPPNRKIAIIPSANEYSIVIANAIRDRLAEFGFELSLYETVPFPTNQWGPTLAKLREDPPAAIAVTHFLPQDLAQFMVQFLTDPTDSPDLHAVRPVLPAFREIGGEAINGVLYSTVIGCLPDDFSAGFRATYREKFGPTAAFLTGSQTYDGLWHYALAAAIAGGPAVPFEREQTEKVSQAMKRLIYRGVNGVYRVDEAGQSAYCYPTQIGDPSLGMAHQFIQHQDYRNDPRPDRAAALRRRPLCSRRPGSRREPAGLPGCDEALRRARRGRRVLHVRGAWRDPRHRRTERGGQDHAVRRGHRRHAGDRGARDAGGRGRHRRLARPHLPDGAGADVPAQRGLRQPQSGAERRGRGLFRPPPPAAGVRDGPRKPAAGAKRRWRLWG
jgi:branched-chain amino acid transport system substrate-binding protein